MHRSLFAPIALALAVLVAAPVRASADEKISLGGPFNTDGPRREGFFHGDREVSLDEFLRAGGEADVADEIKTRRTLRRALMGTGLTVAAGGIVYGASAGPCEGRQSQSEESFDECIERNASRTRGGIAIGLVGATVFTTGLLLSKKIPPIHELRRIATEHNRGLRVAPVVAPGHAGVSLQATF